jgi:hypothetical protein
VNRPSMNYEFQMAGVLLVRVPKGEGRKNKLLKK